MMKKLLGFSCRFVIPCVVFSTPFAIAAAFSKNRWAIFLALASPIFAGIIYLLDLYKIKYDPQSKKQKRVITLLFAFIVVFAFVLCAVSIESSWFYDYPLNGSVDDYGCYPQMFDAFKKGQLNIDTDYDLSLLSKLENPYDPAERREATGERFGVIWDRAFFDGKLYSYFGVAPIFYLYFPAYILTGKVISDALAATLISSAAAIFLGLVLLEALKRNTQKPPFLLVLLGITTLPSGALLWPTLTNANFYHIAVLSGILTVSAFFFFALKADSSSGIKRKALFALSGLSLGAVVASRPNLVLYVIIALPFLISIIKKRPYGGKSLAFDITAFSLPMIFVGVLIMVYNNARFGSPFDFGSAYQLTLADTSTYSFSASLIMPAIFHYFMQPPSLDHVFPFVHPAARRLADYGVSRAVYTDASVGALFFPCAWGSFVFPFVKKNGLKTATFICAVLSVFAVSFFDMCFAGVHLRYAADVMFILALAGVYLLIYLASHIEKESGFYPIAFSVCAAIFAATILIVVPLCLDNERDMIFKYHPEVFRFLM